MAETWVLKALRSRTKSLNLDNGQIRELSPSIGQLDFLTSLSAKSNDLCTLPNELGQLKRLTYLNLGGNRLEAVPICVASLTSLQTLHLFRNSITSLPDDLCRFLHSLTLLNLNENHLSTLPPSVSLLPNLQRLSASGNSITHLPRELGKLGSLVELHLDGNRIKSLPQEVGSLRKLEKLYLQKNQLEELPLSIGGCKRLRIMDVSCNQLEMFPPQLGEVRLRELYFEGNPLIPPIPVPAEQQEEVLPLTELAARTVVKEIDSCNALVIALVGSYPDIQTMVQSPGKCAVCGQPFVNSWLECVHYVSARKLFPLRNDPGVLPLKASLCSYKCFNSETHQFFGVASPPG